MEALTLHRWHFAFTISYHYLFVQLSMGLTLLILILKTMELSGAPEARSAVHFWSKILGITFAMGVVTGIPMEFQFGTNWARFSELTGSIIGQTLAMEGVFAFFLESTFIYLLLFGEKRLGPKGHWVVAFLVFFGTWLSGFFIVATNAWMQHPVGYIQNAEGVFQLESLSALLTNPWAWAEYAHVMLGTVVTASFVMAGVSAYYLLKGQHQRVAKRCISLAVVVGFIAAAGLAFPTGDIQAKHVYQHQPVTFAAMEGHFHTQDGADLVILGQPDLEILHLDNPLKIPKVLSFLTHARWNAEIKGLADFNRELWPDNVELLYYSYHVMVGLGTVFVALLLISVFFVWRKNLAKQRWLLWIWLLALPLPYIANTAGWMTAELGRQPWVVYGLLRTSEGASTQVSAGNTLFTLIGFMGLYALLSLFYFFFLLKIFQKGPESLTQEAQ